ncbi:transglycosylase SLT domain-containing protein, partial [Thermodesulfobacteriota bacterium]
LEKHQVRALVVPSRSTYFLDAKGQPRGIDYVLLKGWEKMLNKGRKKGIPPISVVFIPVTLEELGDALLQGRGDIAGITLKTPSRAREFAYTTPIFSDQNEVVVTRKGGLNISQLTDLSGKEVHVVSGSEQLESMARLNKVFRKKGMAPAKVVQGAPYVNDENLLEMVQGGIIPAAVVPDAFANLWAKVFKDLVVHDKIPVTSGMKAAWAVRKENPLLLANLNNAIATVLKKNKRAFERDFAQYFKNTHWIRNPFEKGAKSEISPHFQKEAANFGMDWLQLMAQGFQESSLNHKARSPYGAVGIMQVLPSTAKWLKVSNYDTVDGNIHAGTKYMEYLMGRYAKEPAISKENRFFFALAGYNAGPGNVNKYRKRATKLGYDPNIWFGNVERACLRYNNLETVNYIRNILNYALAYKTAYDKALQRQELKKRK